MTAAVSARKAARVPCPHCGYKAENAGSLPAHIAMAHPEHDVCTRDAAGCGAHQAVWMPGDERCAARGGRLSPLADEPAPADFKSAAMHEAGIPSQAEVVAFVGRRPEEELACIGANHIPGCDHFEAPAVVPTPAGAQLLEIPLDLVDVGTNVRVDVAELEELAASIAEHGVLQPVKAFQTPEGRFRLVWGQRRVLASRQAGLATIPAIVQPFAEASAGATRSIEQLVENLHRADLNPIDRAEAMRKVVDAGVSQADLARKLGIAPSTVSNDLRLLTLDEKVVERIRAGEITPSHGKAIASLPAKQQAELVKAIVEEKLSAHALEGRLKWKADEAAMDRQRAERTEKWIPKVLKALEAAEVAKDVEITFQSAYNLLEGPLRAAIKKAGWKHLGDGWRRDREKGCDCTAVRIDLSGAKPTIKGVCANEAHRPARGEDTYAKARALRDARNRAVAAALEAQLRPAALSDVVLGVLWQSCGGWGNPPADLVEGLAQQAVWRMADDRLAATAAALGVELPEATS